jgi:virulence-associated protein VapD
MKIKKFNQINEIFGLKKKTEIKLNKIESCVENIINFLKDNNINSWTDFIKSGKFDRWSIDKIIDSSCDTKEELDEVRFKLKLKLSNHNQLKSMLKEYEDMEEYIKCSEIQQEIENKFS